MFDEMIKAEKEAREIRRSTANWSFILTRG